MTAAPDGKKLLRNALTDMVFPTLFVNPADEEEISEGLKGYAGLEGWLVSSVRIKTSSVVLQGEALLYNPLLQNPLKACRWRTP